MDTINSILSNVQSVWASGGTELWLKLALTILGIFGAVIGLYLKSKQRKTKAEKEKQGDRQQDVVDNIKTEDQNSKDGSSVRDRLRRK